MRFWILGLALLPVMRASVAEAPAAAPLGPGWFATLDDPADSLYKVAREALNRGQYRKAADLFADFQRRYPKSSYTADALYWEAFARYKVGDEDNLRTALARLEDQKTRFPKAATAGDARALAVRIQGKLAEGGDVPSAASVAVIANPAPVVSVAPTPSPSPRVAPTPTPGRGDDDCDEDSDVKLAALNAVMQMDAERAMPLLTRVLARRDPGSVCLRRKAVFLVAQKRDENTEDVLLGAARTDPDGEVRQQAVFWLSQVSSPRAVQALDSIARLSNDPELQDKAVFALAQQHDPKATQALRALAERKDMPRDIREKAIFWLGQSHGSGADYLKSLYDRLEDDELKEKVIFGVSQSRRPEDLSWLLGVARNERSSIELRKKAIFWSSQGGASAADLGAMYTSLKDQELKEQTIFALSQLKDPAALDRLVEIAKKDSDPEMRKKALFWLGQLHDPRVAGVIEQMLNE